MLGWKLIRFSKRSPRSLWYHKHVRCRHYLNQWWPMLLTHTYVSGSMKTHCVDKGAWCLRFFNLTTRWLAGEIGDSEHAQRWNPHWLNMTSRIYISYQLLCMVQLSPSGFPLFALFSPRELQMDYRGSVKKISSSMRFPLYQWFSYNLHSNVKLAWLFPYCLMTMTFK